jgi:hypothetical protein
MSLNLRVATHILEFVYFTIFRLRYPASADKEFPMKRTWILLGLTILITIVLLGCATPQEKAQKMMAAGQYEQVVALYQNDPNLAAVVKQAKDKIAEKLLAEGKYSSVLEVYPTSPAAKEAKNKLAEQLLNEKKFQEVIDKYGDTPAALIAKAELEKLQIQADAATGAQGNNGAQAKVREDKANAELARIMSVKIKELRMKALKEFVANPTYKGTAAVQKARAQIK